MLEKNTKKFLPPVTLLVKIEIRFEDVEDVWLPAYEIFYNKSVQIGKSQSGGGGGGGSK